MSKNDNVSLEVQLAIAELMFLELGASLELKQLGIACTSDVSTLAIALQQELDTIERTGGKDFLPSGHIHFEEASAEASAEDSAEGWIAIRKPETYEGIFSRSALGHLAPVGKVRRSLRSKYTGALDKLLAGDTIAFSSESDLKNFRVFCWRKGLTLETSADKLTATLLGRREAPVTGKTEQVSFTVVSTPATPTTDSPDSPNLQDIL